ncbi:MAG: radical SAM protein [Alphaproteobacteria bacterium]|nr:MAG: radical SAM protein [Alphaproteobacteria bacterium]
MAHDTRANVLSKPFTDPMRTATGEERAFVDLRALETLWFNTGTLCNIACAHCYIESSPRNDSLTYLRAEEVAEYLDEIAALALPTREIGITGGEPFMNPDIIRIMRDILGRGFDLLVLTNAMKPLWHKRAALLDLQRRFGELLRIRVSLDHFDPAHHEEERGAGSFASALEGLKWLSGEGFRVHVAGRLRWDEDEAQMRAGFARLFAEHDLPIDARDRRALVLFPEMDADRPVPEITTRCWEILGRDAEEMMCATSRMVVKSKGSSRPHVQACTLLAHEEQFTTGTTLAEACAARVRLNHPHCARFCVLGGASCSANA